MPGLNVLVHFTFVLGGVPTSGARERGGGRAGGGGGGRGRGVVGSVASCLMVPTVTPSLTVGAVLGSGTGANGTIRMFVPLPFEDCREASSHIYIEIRFSCAYWLLSVICLLGGGEMFRAVVSASC